MTLWQTVLTTINLTIAVITLTLGAVKAIAARQERTTVLTLTASVLLHSGVIFLLATPPVYRAVGSLLSAPNLPALGIDIATLLCVGHAHYMCLLWHPTRHTADERSRALRFWTLFYAAPIALMVILYAIAPLHGAAEPLHFAPTYTHVPAVVALKITYFTALILAVVATMVLCRDAALPDRPDLARDVRTCMRWFAVAVGLDLATAVFTLSSMAGATLRGDHQLDILADISWVATILSGIAATNSLGRMVLMATRNDRRDCRELHPLWHLVTDDAPHLVIHTSRWNARIKLARMMTETRDGARALTPWTSTAPAQAVDHLLNKTSTPDSDVPDRAAAQAAATLLHAATRRASGQFSTPAGLRLGQLPGLSVPAAQERAHLVKVARHLSHPLVAKAVQMAETHMPHVADRH